MSDAQLKEYFLGSLINDLENKINEEPRLKYNSGYPYENLRTATQRYLVILNDLKRTCEREDNRKY